MQYNVKNAFIWFKINSKNASHENFQFIILSKSRRPNHCTKMKFSIKHFFSKCDQIHSFLRICSHLLKKSLMDNFIFCAMNYNIFIYSNVAPNCMFMKLLEIIIDSKLNLKKLLRSYAKQRYTKSIHSDE